ncbi:MAG: hypothetical protein JO362_11760 [Streptomycetaceae bacterium]|nr:hypothetical protein [Streptomycetaceae bacterium]
MAYSFANPPDPATVPPSCPGQFAALARNRLKKTQHRSDLLDGFIAETGPVLTPT